MRHFIFDLRCCHPGFHRLSWAALVVVLSFSFASGQSENRTFEAQHEQALRANPDDIHLRISLDSEKNSFHIGDSILLKYEFTADVSGKYVAGARYFDRAERSVLESFITDRPQDALDPLREFWQLYESLSGFLFSSSRTPELRLDSHPQYDTLELTHYLRFTKPGLYHLYVTTHSALPPPARETQQGGPSITSENIIEFRLLPQDRATAKSEVDEIAARGREPPWARFTPLEAFRLFEINTPEARSTAVSLDTRRSNFPDSHSIALATMIAAPTRSEAIRLLNNRLQDPAVVADEDLILDLALLNFQEKNLEVHAANVRSADALTLARWRSQYSERVAETWYAVVSKLKIREPVVRASTLKSLDNLSRYYFGSEPLPIRLADQNRIRLEHLATLPDLPANELANDLLNFSWAETLPNDQVLSVLIAIYAAPPAGQGDFVREVALKEISKRDPKKAEHLFTEHVLAIDAPLDWNRVRYMKLPPSPALDAELINILEDRWTERMSRVAPIIGLYATDSILSRAKKIYEIYGPDWPCSIEAGLLTYFLRVAPGYGTEKLGSALAAYYDRGGSDCFRGSLLADIALLRYATELKPFVSAALNDPRPSVAVAGAQVSGFGGQGKIPLRDLLRRLRALHDEWPDFSQKSSSDAEYLYKWNSGYDELERVLTIDFVNAEDAQENVAIWKEALESCVTDFCRNQLRERLARSRF